MRYLNADRVLPAELVQAIQNYVQGEYLYIPTKNRSKTSVTDYRMELEKRDAHIYSKYLLGMSTRHLAPKYNLSESSIRRIVLKKRRTYMTIAAEIPEILSHWGLQGETVRQIYNTVWQVGENHVLKVYQDLEMLERNSKIADILCGMQIPVGKAVPTSDGRQYAAEKGTFYFLAEKLPGSSLADHRHIADNAAAMGEIIVRLHIAFKKCEDKLDFWNNSLLDEMNGWIRKGLEDNKKPSYPGWRRYTMNYRYS